MFFDDKNLEKESIEESYIELRSLYKIINVLINKYSKIGNIIEFDLYNKETIMSKFNTYINKLNRVLNLYSALDYSFASADIRSAINTQINSIRNLINQANNLKNKIKNTVDEINEYEQNFSKNMNNFQIKQLQKPEIEKYISTGKVLNHMTSVINEQQITNISDKLDLYKKSQNSNFLDILLNLKEMLTYYKTPNTNLIESCRIKLSNKFNMIDSYNKANIDVYRKNVEKYHSLNEVLTQKASELGGK